MKKYEIFQKREKGANEYKPLILDLIKRMNIEKIECKQELVDITKPGDKWHSSAPGKRIITIIEKR